MGFVKVGSVGDLRPGEMKGVEAAGKPVLLVNLNGKYYAIRNVCTHMSCALSGGKLTEDTVQCPCHGSIFDIKTGSVLKGPARKPETSYEVKIEGNEISVNI